MDHVSPPDIVALTRKSQSYSAPSINRNIQTGNSQLWAKADIWDTGAMTTS